ncbi:nuclear factor 7, brain-like [Ambystoma mexicanum]|uniref:nuclear factor 7, brain-like n=1 Tax=Ambystoma mexicanum TaxID=8296 RepID=UPI0037E746E5
MSSQVLAESLSHEVTCPICLEFYTDPVRLDCEHNFCRLCLTNHQKQREKEEDDEVGDQRTFTCPQCLESFPPKSQPKSNRLLATIVERVRSLLVESTGGLPVCSLHEERMKLYCEDDEEPICVVCGVSKDHKGHRMTPLHEATALIKEALGRSLRQLEARRDSILDIQQQQQKMAQELKVLAASLKENVISEFQKLQRFLQEEEAALLEKLRADEWHILQEMEGNMEALVQEKAALEQEIQRVHDSLATQDSTTWLKDGAELKQRWTKGLRECVVVAQSLDVGVYRGPLQYMAWKKMWSVIDPVPESLTFDPLSANSYLVVSEDRISARYSYASQPCPESLEHFEFCACVLACQSFSSGRHYWEVDVGDRPDWDLGVAEESAGRDGWIVISPENGYWTFGHVACGTVGVYLDCEAGQLSFYDAEATKHLHTITGSFTKKLYPFFFPSGDSNAKPLRLLHSGF